MVCVCVDGQVDEWAVTLALALTLTLALSPNPNKRSSMQKSRCVATAAQFKEHSILIKQVQ